MIAIINMYRMRFTEILKSSDCGRLNKLRKDKMAAITKPDKYKYFWIPTSAGPKANIAAQITK